MRTTGSLSGDTRPMEDKREGGAEKKVDEGWKEDVRREKERLSGEEPRARPEPPQATFVALVQQLATQALLQMGMAAPRGQKPMVDLQGAKYVIDTLQMIEEKTKGNLTPEESRALSTILADLRAGFVGLATGGGSAAP